VTAARFIAQTMRAPSREVYRGWVRVALGEVLQLLNGRAYKQEELLTAGTPVLRIQNLNGGNRWYYSDLSLDPDKYCAPGDLLYAWSASFGPYQYDGPRAIFHYHIWRVVPGPSLDVRFAYWLLKEITAEVRAAAHGVAMPHMTKAGMEAWPICLPPINEQRRVVAKLDALQARSRRARESLDAVPPLLEKLRRSILAAAFRGDLTKDWRAKHKDIEPAADLLKRIRTERRKKWEATELAKLKAKGKPPTDDRWKTKYKEPEPVDASGLPELPEGWCWASVAELVVDGPSNGFSPKADRAGAGTPTLRLSATTEGYCTLSDETTKRTTERVSEDAPYWLMSGDILIQRANTIDYVGTSAVFNGPDRTYIYPDLMMRLRASPLVGPTLLWRALSWSFCRRFMRARATGTAGNMPKINGETVRSVPVPLAPSVEQTVLLRKLDQAERQGHLLLSRTIALSGTVSGLERSLLAKAFRGELVPQDPNDEPAEALLERLSQQRLSDDQPDKRGRRRSGGERKRA
jgi:type I restriction enzyme, S subunit